MGIQEDWRELVFSLNVLQKGSAKRQFRHAIKTAWGGLCAYCREQRATTVDHLKPRCRGGSDLRSNLVPCCVDCNQSKGSQDFEEWFTTQHFYNRIAHDLIDEWVANQRPDYEEDDDSINDRTTVCSTESTIRSLSDVAACAWEDPCKGSTLTHGAT